MGNRQGDAEGDEKLSQPWLEKDSDPAGFEEGLSTAQVPDEVTENDEDDVNSAAVLASPLNGAFSQSRSFSNEDSDSKAARVVASETAEVANREDEALVLRVLNGDRDAFAYLVEKYKVAVFNHCYRMLHNPDEAEDASQEVFLRAYNQLRTYQLGRRFSSWILSIASHYCIDLLRRRRPVVDIESIAFWKSSDEPEPEELAMTEETRDEVRDLLKALPEKYASVVALRYWQDMSYDEIAEVTGLSVGTVKTRLFRARELLAKELDKQRRNGRGAGSQSKDEKQLVRTQKQERSRDKATTKAKQIKGNQNVLP